MATIINGQQQVVHDSYPLKDKIFITIFKETEYGTSEVKIEFDNKLFRFLCNEFRLKDPKIMGPLLKRKRVSIVIE